ncbi:Acetyl esterase/lipase [Mycolicibacterium rutilum]|uniref:Acetyl esterase/lipase n=1 Tax=Mycolicibacterium rutilum TaxID=370526 RepID=A0A1H6JPW7_MYCRU|nr:alpha/beta hydrolase [Mycolicibacterium rutilum]SEH64513.1 Acetyl esterase/lipase [Mycolicibacterium rutilum]
MLNRASCLIASVGLGVAIWTGLGCGVALADPTDSGSESAASESSEKASEDSTPASAQNDDNEKDEVDRVDDEIDAAEDETDTDDTESRPKSKKSRLSTPVEPEADAAPATVVVTEPDPVDERPVLDVPEEVDMPDEVVEADEPAEGTVDLPPPPESVAAALSPLSTAGGAPEIPVNTPAEWAFLAAARREIAAPDVAADWESQYTGAPSLVHELVVTGLRVVDLVLKPFGGLLTFTSLEVPLFTDGVPPFFFRHGLRVERTEFEGTPVWSLRPQDPSGKYIVALHGGAYVAEASLFHWWTYTDMARDTGATVLVPLYPLVPDGGTADVVVPQTADYLEQLITEHGADNVSVIGDSAGGGIALAAVQELVHRGSAVPERMVLFAPWLDATVSDPLSRQLDPGDPLLDVPNLVRAGQDWGGVLGVDHRYASPLYGSIEGLPPIAVYSGSLDLLTPDTLRLQQLVTENGYDNFTFNLSRGRLHDWAIFGFLPDAQAVRPSVYRDLLGEPEARGDHVHQRRRA